jgi:Transmembrane secretion effector
VTGAAKGGDPGGFAPLREPTCRTMLGARFAGNIGGWMQTVGAQWLMLTGDLVDRRRPLLGTTAFMAGDPRRRDLGDPAGELRA